MVKRSIFVRRGFRRIRFGSTAECFRMSILEFTNSSRKTVIQSNMFWIYGGMTICKLEIQLQCTTCLFFVQEPCYFSMQKSKWNFITVVTDLQWHCTFSGDYQPRQMTNDIKMFTLAFIKDSLLSSSFITHVSSSLLQRTTHRKEKFASA
jgi:hypothetical protein